MHVSLISDSTLRKCPSMWSIWRSGNSGVVFIRWCGWQPQKIVWHLTGLKNLWKMWVFSWRVSVLRHKFTDKKPSLHHHDFQGKEHLNQRLLFVAPSCRGTSRIPWWTKMPIQILQPFKPFVAGGSGLEGRSGYRGGCAFGVVSSCIQLQF